MRDRSAGSRSARVLDLSLGMMRSAAMKIKYFKSAHDFRRWMEKNHAITQELWVGYYKKSSRQPSITWPESVDEALCFGWIDGIRKSVDDPALHQSIYATKTRKHLERGQHQARARIERERLNEAPRHGRV